ncbi:MAG TPA: ABC transporter permease [Gaiellales bacterium]|jgi:ABC-2 type transport system permease protein
MSGRRAIILVARREIRERLRSRALLYSTGLLLLVVGASTAFTAIVDPHTTYDVAVTRPAPPGLTAALQRAAAPLDARVRVAVVASPAAGRRALEAKDADALIVLPADALVFRAAVDTKLAAIADTAVRGLRRHLPPAPELRPVTIEPGTGASTDAEILVAMIGSVAMIVSLSVYGTWVLAGVIEEKQNRVVELVISTVQPRHLMAGKVIGIGLLGLGQLALVAGFTAALFAAGAFDAPAGLGGSVALVVPWFGLGFALYAVAYAAAGALASRQQDADSAGQPVTTVLVTAYLLSYVVVSANASGTLAHVLTVLPLTSPFVLPARSALVGVPVWEHAVALLLIVATIYALLRFAGRIYAHGLLHSGPRIPLHTAWRLGRQA